MVVTRSQNAQTPESPRNFGTGYSLRSRSLDASVSPSLKRPRSHDQTPRSSKRKRAGVEEESAVSAEQPGTRPDRESGSQDDDVTTALYSTLPTVEDNTDGNDGIIGANIEPESVAREASKSGQTARSHLSSPVREASEPKFTPHSHSVTASLNNATASSTNCLQTKPTSSNSVSGLESPIPQQVFTLSNNAAKLNESDEATDLGSPHRTGRDQLIAVEFDTNTSVSTQKTARTAGNTTQPSVPEAGPYTPGGQRIVSRVAISPQSPGETIHSFHLAAIVGMQSRHIAAPSGQGVPAPAKGSIEDLTPNLDSSSEHESNPQNTHPISSAIESKDVVGDTRAASPSAHNVNPDTFIKEALPVRQRQLAGRAANSEHALAAQDGGRALPSIRLEVYNQPVNGGDLEPAATNQRVRPEQPSGKRFVRRPKPSLGRTPAAITLAHPPSQDTACAVVSTNLDQRDRPRAAILLRGPRSTLTVTRTARLKRDRLAARESLRSKPMPTALEIFRRSLLNRHPRTSTRGPPGARHTTKFVVK